MGSGVVESPPEVREGLGLRWAWEGLGALPDVREGSIAPPEVREGSRGTPKCPGGLGGPLEVRDGPRRGREPFRMSVRGQ